MKWIRILLIVLIGILLFFIWHSNTVNKSPDFINKVLKEKGKYKELSVIAEELHKSFAGTSLEGMSPFKKTTELFLHERQIAFKGREDVGYFFAICKVNAVRENLVLNFTVFLDRPELDLPTMKNEMSKMIQWHSLFFDDKEIIMELYDNMQTEIMKLSEEELKESGKKIRLSNGFYHKMIFYVTESKAFHILLVIVHR